MDVFEPAPRNGDGGGLEVNVTRDLRCLAGQALLGEESSLLVHARPAELVADQPDSGLHARVGDVVDSGEDRSPQLSRYQGSKNASRYVAEKAAARGVPRRDKE